MLNEETKDKSLVVIEDPNKGVVIQNLKQVVISNLAEAQKLIEFGNCQRTMAATLVNQHSSRSHAIITITIQKTQQLENFKHEVTISKLSIIDLAGSERGNTSL